MKTKFLNALSLAVIMAMLFTSLALADALNGDALYAQSGAQDVINRTVPGGETVTYEFSAWVANTGGSNDNVFPGNLTVDITRTGDWHDISSGTLGSFTFTGYDAQQTGTIVISVPCDSQDILKEMTVQLDADPSTNGKSLDSNKSSVTLKYRITAGPNGSNCSTADTTPPVIASHGDEYAEATSALGAFVSYAAPATSDDVDGAGVATCAPASGSQFALGDTAVTCNASDSAGNAAAPTTFVVHVVDTTPPAIASHLDEIAEATSAAGAIVSYAAPATFDAVDGAGSATCLPASGSTFALGETTVTCDATDAHGNSAISTTFKVTVVDTTPPMLVSCDLPDDLWHANDVTLHCHYSDLVSGLSQVALSTNVVGGTETNNAFASADGAQACDNAGNCAASPDDIGGNKIDKKAPSITINIPLNGASYLLNEPVLSSFNCVDGGSGVANCTGSASVDTTTTGSKTFPVNATDAVGNSNISSTTYSVAFKICALYDQTKAHKSGSTVPVKLQLCDFNGVNYSSASIVVQAISVKKLDNTSSGVLDDSGSANSPDMNFRYDATLGGTGGYIFNLSTKGLTTGTWKVIFTVNGAGSYSVQFDIK